MQRTDRVLPIKLKQHYRYEKELTDELVLERVPESAHSFTLRFYTCESRFMCTIHIPTFIRCLQRDLPDSIFMLLLSEADFSTLMEIKTQSTARLVLFLKQELNGSPSTPIGSSGPLNCGLENFGSFFTISYTSSFAIVGDCLPLYREILNKLVTTADGTVTKISLKELYGN